MSRLNRARMLCSAAESPEASSLAIFRDDRGNW
jgi:hypothetical protein